jgi:hypothetical protein
MTSLNELRKQIALAIKPSLDSESSVAQGSNGDLYIRPRDKVFRVDIEEIAQITDANDPLGAAARFMETLPYRF